MTVRLKYSLSGSISASVFGLEGEWEEEYATGTTCIKKSECEDSGAAHGVIGGYKYTSSDWTQNWLCPTTGSTGCKPAGHTRTGTKTTTTGCYTGVNCGH
jgi:hypothetical protein